MQDSWQAFVWETWLMASRMFRAPRFQPHQEAAPSTSRRRRIRFGPQFPEV